MSVEIDVNIGRQAGHVLPIPITTQDIVLLTGDGYLSGWSIREASGASPADVRNSVTSPGALATIATTPALGAGVYDVIWSVELSGTLAAAEANNFQLMNGAAVVAGSENGIVAGVYPQPDTRVTVVAGSTVSIQSIGAGTVGAVYTGDVSVTPDPFFGAVVEIQDSTGPIGESGMDLQDSDTEWFGSPGIPIRGQILLHVVTGTVTGCVYATYYK